MFNIACVVYCVDGRERESEHMKNLPLLFFNISRPSSIASSSAENTDE